MIDYTSNLLSDKQKAEGVYAFSQSELFDRIINLKLYTRETGTNKIRDEYVIRSDWEVYYPDLPKVIQSNGTTQDLQRYYIRRFVHKPSIKVQYKQIATGTAVEIDIFVSNFALLSSDGRTLMAFNNLTYPLGMVEIQMGYFGQFNKKPETLEEYFDFSRNKNADLLTVNVGHGYVQTDKLPPDGVLHIHGYVGSCYTPPVTGEGVFQDSYDNITSVARPFNTYLENYIFTNITRRFLRKPLYNSEEVADLEVDKDTGLLPWEEADKYGVHIYLSDRLLETCHKRMSRTVKDADGKEIKHSDMQVVGHYSESVVKALNLVRDELGIDMSFKALNDGNFIAYLSEESMDSELLAKSLDKYKIEDVWLAEAGSVVDKIYHNVLPAVENITTDALCTIVCPFFFFLNPFDMIKFKSRYALGGVVSYYANFTVEESKFYALYMTVSFATVEDINECNIVCTGSRES